jgi:hypothetical protein
MELGSGVRFSGVVSAERYPKFLREDNMKNEIVVPDKIIDRLKAIQQDANLTYQKACSVQVTKLSKAAFQFTHSAPSDILTDDERAQSVCFITKYENLPEVEGVQIEKSGENFHVANIAFFRHILNEFRPIIQNQRDSIHYMNIHKLIREKLLLDDPHEGLVLAVIDELDNDISPTFLKYLNERAKTIRIIIDGLDFDYIYNGILQHSDHTYTDRFLKDYNSGELNYIFLQHAFLLNAIKQELYWHYKILNFLTFPKLGPL